MATVKHELSAHIDQAMSAPDVDPTVVSLVDTLHDYLVKKGGNIKAMIDTPEERKALEDVVGQKFDERVAPNIPSKIRGYVRRGLLAAIDAMLVAIGG